MLAELRRAQVDPRECQGKIFGGGNMFPQLYRADSLQVGQKNGETARELWERALAPLGLRLLAQVIDQAKTSGILPSMPQDEQFATNAPRLDVEKRPNAAPPKAAPKSAAS